MTTYLWVPDGGGDWNDPHNWETLTEPPPIGPPGAGDDVVIIRSSTIEITTDGVDIGSLKAADVIFDGDLSVSGDLSGGQYTGGKVEVGGQFYGAGFDGTSLSAGSISASTLSGGKVTTDEIDSALVDGATVSVTNLEPSADDIVTVRAGTLSAATMSLDQQFSGLVVSGGVATIGAATTVDGPADGAAGILVSGGQLILKGALTLDGGAYLNDGSVTVPSAGGVVTTTKLTVGDTGSGRMFVAGAGQVNVSGDFTLGESGTGSLTVENGGHITVGGEMESAVQSGSTATATISDPADILTFDDDWEIGVAGAATWTLTGSVSATVGGSTELGVSSGGSGTLTVSDGGTSVVTGGGGVTVGGEGEGTLTVQSGATFDDSAGDLTLGEADKSQGTLQINDSGSTLIVGDDATIGAAGTGSISIVGGAATFSGALTLGESKGAKGGLTVNGGNLALTGDMTIGSAGAGSVTVGPKGVIAPSSTDTITLGEEAGGKGTLTVSGSGASVESFGLTVGGAGGGALSIGGHGKVTTTGDAAVGEDVTATIQKVTVTSAGSWTVSGGLSLGEAAIAAATVSAGGLIQVDGDLTMGETAAATGILAVSGVLSAGSVRTPSRLKWGGVLDVGEAGTGNLAISAGGQAAALAGDEGLVEIASGKGAKGTITVSGAGSDLTGQKLTVGGGLTAAGGAGALTVGSGGAAHFAKGGVIWAGGQITIGGALTLGSTIDNGVLNVTSGEAVVTGGFSGAGKVSVGAGGVFALYATKTATANKVTIGTAAGTFRLRGGSGADLFEMAATALKSRDTIAGGAGHDTLDFTTAGAIAATAFTHVSGIDQIDLAVGDSTLALTNALVQGADAHTLTIVGAIGHATIYAGQVSAGGTLVFNGASTQDTIIVAGAGAMNLTGGLGADTFKFAVADLTSADIVNGGVGRDALVFTTAGAIAAAAFAHVTHIDQIDLARGTNTLTLTNALVHDSDADTLTVLGGAGDDTINAGSVGTAASVVFQLGGGANTVHGGRGDNVYKVDREAGTLSLTNSFTGGAAAHGTVEFGPGLSDQDLWFARSGANLVIDVMGSTEKVTLNGWFGASKSAQVREIQAGGLEIDSGVANLVSAMASFSAANPSFNPTATGAVMPTNTALQAAITADWHHS